MTTRDTVRGKKVTDKNNESNWQQRTEILSLDMSEEYKKYPTVTANDLRRRSERPKKVKMLMRDFIEGMLWVIIFGLSSLGHLSGYDKSLYDKGHGRLTRITRQFI